MSRIVVVSNRVAVPRAGRPPQGGLETGVRAALEARGGLWFGWSGAFADETAASLERTRVGSIEFATVALSKRDYAEYYKGFSNRVLWPLFHSRLDRMEYWRVYDDGYRRVGAILAERLAGLLRQDDRIWVHDYHLIPLGEALRRLGCRQAIGFFLHVPFPAFEILRALPRFRRLTRMFGAYDLVGFQTAFDERNFKDCVRRALPRATATAEGIAIDGHRTRTGTFPISVDVDEVAAAARRGAASPAGRRLAESLDDRRLIIGVDRLDYTKGLERKLQGFEHLLERHPDLRGKVVFLQIAQPSRGDVPDYQQMRDRLDALTGAINARYSEYDWVPIRYLNKGFGRGTIMGFLAAADIALITPLRDGMNLVAKEFVAAQQPDAPGALVLSVLAGAARELDGAVLVNPHDVDDIAEGLGQALLMPKAERQARWRRMIQTLRRKDIHAWRRRFVETLDAASPRRAAGSTRRSRRQ